jgi:predicted DNA-binding transcriptional regulator AlpA
MQPATSSNATAATDAATGDHQSKPENIISLRTLPADPDTLIRASDVPEYVGIAKQTLNRWRHQGDPPRFVRLGRRVFYRAGDLREWIRGQVRENTISQN